MSFLLQQLRQLGMVGIVMVCAAGGTAGLLKIIRKLMPGGDFPQSPIPPKPNGKDEPSDD